MGYRFPRRAVSTRDIPDPKLIREQVQGVAEEIQGKLNEHNVEGGDLANPTFAANRVPPKMLYDFHYARVSSDNRIAANALVGPYPYLPDGTDGNAFRVSDAGEWETL